MENNGMEKWSMTYFWIKKAPKDSEKPLRYLKFQI